MYSSQELEWYLYYPLLIATLGSIFVLFRFVWNLAPSNQIVSDEGRGNARRLSHSRYYLKATKVGPLGITLELETADLDRKKEILTFQSRHPDYEQLKKLPRLEVVEFQFTQLALFRVGNAEVCAYLKLKCGQSVCS
jgi:hypothetical protein